MSAPTATHMDDITQMWVENIGASTTRLQAAANFRAAMASLNLCPTTTDQYRRVLDAYDLIDRDLNGWTS